MCRESQITEATYYRWRIQFSGHKADDAKRLKDLERENATLKRLLADAELEKAALKEIAKGKLLSPQRRWVAVYHLTCVPGVSERFACRVTGQNRGTQRRLPARRAASPSRLPHPGLRPRPTRTHYRRHLAPKPCTGR